jgi:hypothetical protein
MPSSKWRKLYRVEVAAAPEELFGLLAGLPGYGSWLPGSVRYGGTTDAEPYPVQPGTGITTGIPASPARTGGGPSPDSSGPARSTFITSSLSGSSGPRWM